MIIYASAKTKYVNAFANIYSKVQILTMQHFNALILNTCKCIKVVPKNLSPVLAAVEKYLLELFHFLTKINATGFKSNV